MLIRQYKNKTVKLEDNCYKFNIGPASFESAQELSSTPKNPEGELILTISNKFSRKGTRPTFTELYHKWKTTSNPIYLKIMSSRILDGDFE